MTETRQCDCGFIVSGRTEGILESNYNSHKKSATHKKWMKIKKTQESYGEATKGKALVSGKALTRRVGNTTSNSKKDGGSK